MSDGFASCLSPASFWTPKHHVVSAWLEHAPFAFWLIGALEPRVMVELGTHQGFSYLTMCQAVKALGLPTRCFAVDTWEGDDHAGFYGESIYKTLYDVNERDYSSFSRMLRARFDAAVSNFNDGEIDLLHIDGRHGYEDVLEDFTMWQPKLSGRAVVMFHDTNVRENDFGVWKLWADIAKTYPSFEFVQSHGLGVIGFGKDLPAKVLPLFQAEGAEAIAIREAYARLGSSITFDWYRKELADRDRTIGELKWRLGERGKPIHQRVKEAVEKTLGRDGK